MSRFPWRTSGCVCVCSYVSDTGRCHVDSTTSVSRGPGCTFPYTVVPLALRSGLFKVLGHTWYLCLAWTLRTLLLIQPLFDAGYTHFPFYLWPLCSLLFIVICPIRPSTSFSQGFTLICLISFLLLNDLTLELGCPGRDKNLRSATCWLCQPWQILTFYEHQYLYQWNRNDVYINIVSVFQFPAHSECSNSVLY